MKKVLFLSVILVMILSGCNFSTPADIDFDEWGLGGPTEHGRSARIGNVVLYDCTASYGTFIKSENDEIGRVSAAFYERYREKPAFAI